jgi:hypothetical protein
MAERSRGPRPRSSLAHGSCARLHDVGVPPGLLLCPRRCRGAGGRASRRRSRGDIGGGRRTPSPPRSSGQERPSRKVEGSPVRCGRLRGAAGVPADRLDPANEGSRRRTGTGRNGSAARERKARRNPRRRSGARPSARPSAGWSRGSIRTRNRAWRESLRAGSSGPGPSTTPRKRPGDRCRPSRTARHSPSSRRSASIRLPRRAGRAILRKRARAPRRARPARGCVGSAMSCGGFPWMPPGALVSRDWVGCRSAFDDGPEHSIMYPGRSTIASATVRLEGCKRPGVAQRAGRELIRKAGGDRRLQVAEEAGPPLTVGMFPAMLIA